MRKFLPALLLPLLLLSSCSRQADSNEIVLRIANWGGAGEDNEFESLIQSFYDQFERDNPGIKIRIENNPENYVQKMLLNFVAGTEPDIMIVDASSAAVFINNGVLEDLTPMIENDPEFNIDDYFPNVVDIGRREDKLYTIPGDFTPMVIYYNKKLFDEAGVPYPTGDWDFEQFRVTAQRLTDPSKGTYGFVFSNWMPGWVMWLWNNGAEPLSPDGTTASGYFDSPKSAETIQWLRELVTKHKVAPSFSQVAAQGMDLFANGKVAMTVSGHWSMVSYRAAKGIDWKELGVVQLPHNTPKSHTVMYEAGWGITSRSKHKEAAWKFIKMWTSYKTQLTYNKSGIAISARKDVAKERAVDEVEKQFVSIVPTARPPAGSWVEGYEVVENQGRKAMDTILNNPSASVQEVLTRAAQRIDQEFAKRL